MTLYSVLNRQQPWYFLPYTSYITKQWYLHMVLLLNLINQRKKLYIMTTTQSTKKVYIRLERHVIFYGYCQHPVLEASFKLLGWHSWCLTLIHTAYQHNQISVTLSFIGQKINDKTKHNPTKCLYSSCCCFLSVKA